MLHNELFIINRWGDSKFNHRKPLLLDMAEGNVQSILKFTKLTKKTIVILLSAWCAITFLRSLLGRIFSKSYKQKETDGSAIVFFQILTLSSVSFPCFSQLQEYHKKINKTMINKRDILFLSFFVFFWFFSFNLIYLININKFLLSRIEVINGFKFFVQITRLFQSQIW